MVDGLVYILKSKRGTGEQIESVAIEYPGWEFSGILVAEVESKLFESAGDDVPVVEQVVDPEIEDQEGRLPLYLHFLRQFPGVSSEQIDGVLRIP